MAEVAQASLVLNDLSTAIHPECDSAYPHRICFVGELAEDKELHDASLIFDAQILNSKDGIEYVNDKDYITYFVLNDFDSEEFENLKKRGARILGKPAFLEMWKQRDTKYESYKSRPVYCFVMRNCVLALSGFKNKSGLEKLLRLVHYMGGSLKPDINERVTHLIAKSATGAKYQYAVTFGLPVMSNEWVNAAWTFRDEVGVRAETTEALMQYKLKLFQNLKIVFVQFSDDDREQMERLVQQNGGIVTTLDDSTASHIVLDDQNLSEKPPNCPERAFVVKGEWFWASIQMDACTNEQLYLFEPTQNVPSTFSPRSRVFSPSTPGSRSRRRKRLRETVQQLAENDSPSGMPTTCPPASKRRSSVGDLAFLSTSDGSFLEDSLPLPSGSTPSLDKTPLSPPPLDLKHLTPRQRVFQELVKTESNYVGILDTINNVIKEPLENENQPGGAMLDSQELKNIFGNLPPIHEVHTKLRNELLHLAYHYTDDASIGQIILNHTSDLERAYPPFVNYFDKVKSDLQEITMKKPRFHAFLKIAQNKPECGRQSLRELLIRPVQRLPSMSLLIHDILKHTDRASADHAALEAALDQIKSIITFINDDKRRTDEKFKLFELHNDIENCPPNLVAAHRTYVSKVDVTELSDSLSRRGDSLSLFLFNDVVEICKRKSKYNSIKSPSRANISTIKIKGYRHVQMMELSHIKRVVDIRETDDCKNVFALIVRRNQDMEEKLFTFTIIPDETTKAAFLRSLCCNISNVVCHKDVETLLVAMDPHHLDIASSDVSITNALSKALRFATRTGRKVTRAFSFNRSPSKLKRAVSTVMSPFANSSSFGLRGATSVNNLADLSLSSTPPPCSNGSMPAPLSTPTPRRKLPVKRI